MRIFHYCNDCKSEGIKDVNTPLRTTVMGNDGFGQPVRFVECKCGGVLDGYLDLNFYSNEDKEDDSSLDYYKHRINYYYGYFKEEEDSIRERMNQKPSLSKHQIERLQRNLEIIDKHPNPNQTMLDKKEKMLKTLEDHECMTS